MASKQQILLYLALFLVLATDFMINLWSVAPSDLFGTWQLDSESTYVNRFEHDLLGVQDSYLGLLWSQGASNDIWARFADAAFPFTAQYEQITYIPYESMIGGYASVLSFIYSMGFIDGLTLFHLFNVICLCVITLFIFSKLRRLGGPLLSAAWIIGIALSPWIVTASKNLYWSPWLWFLPFAASLTLASSNSRLTRLLSAIAVIVAFILKYWLTGYEVATSITVLALSAPAISFVFMDRSARRFSRWVVDSFIIAGSSILAFVSVLTVHAILLTGNLSTGIQRIWIDAVLRRTYGSSSDYGTEYSESLSASPTTVVARYLSPWATDMLHFGFKDYFAISLTGKLFVPVLILAFAIIVVRIIRRDVRWQQDACLLFFGLLAAISWFLAAKGHSFIHTFILFFLWYFLLIQALIFILARAIIDVVSIYRKRRLPSTIH